ncbi:histone-lysine N-methyltransferase, H3 lysine-79 specific-like [Melia azedarach]|uniref:Histone-lysine N-methyltransferase, H3 lysine-79 specific-like n=1 Tax=Melia azedarach TaxID=155640 RepID=A0ACC1YI47_MELAZ|nr:histone-lysine N-methyltransferase, H3 lysine-79 specific-like [Melia azedarach]
MVPPRRKKWTEAEEKTLIDKYGEMVADGTLAKMKTREKKYKPIAHYVNSVHHVRDPMAFPWQWTWKDVSTKVQNMRHQYLLVKQKIKKPELSVDNSVGGECNAEEFDWVEGLTHWSNFLRYKDVFGDVTAPYNSNINNGSDLMAVVNEDRENGGGFVGVGNGMEIAVFGQMGHSADGDFTAINGRENGVMSLGFEYDGDEVEENFNGNQGRVREDGDNGFGYEEVEPIAANLKKKKRKMLKALEKKTLGFLANQLGQLREIEARFEQREAERERERQRRENFRIKLEQEWERKLEEREKEREEREKAREKLRRQRIQEWEAMEKESEERERRRRDEGLIQESEWEERINRRRSEWKKRIDEMLSQHRAEMGQMQARILHEQQNLTSQLLGIVSQWTGHPTGLSDHTGASSHYLSQMMQNLHHVNGMVHGDTRVEGDNQDDQFIVDG